MAKKKATAPKASKKRATTKNAATKTSGAKKKPPLKAAGSRSAKNKSATATVLLGQVGDSSAPDESRVVTRLPEIAFYYPNPYWRDADWVKNLILFFDGIGMLIPDYMPDASSLDDEAVIAGLKEHNLFHVFQPETFLDNDSAILLTNAMTKIISSGVLDDLDKKNQGRFAELSMSRMGYHVAEEYAKKIFNQLKKHGLAEESKDGLSIPMHKSARYIILILLSQILRSNGRKAGFELLPATDVPQLVGALSELLAKPKMPSAEHVISLDIQAVGVDVSSIPIDEILSFRQENLKAYRKYARGLRLCIHDLGLMHPEDQQARLDERQEEITSIGIRPPQDVEKGLEEASHFSIECLGSRLASVPRGSNRS